METYQEFLGRIASFETERMMLGGKDFPVAPALAQKVGRDNRFKGFYGDTVVFTLSDATKSRLAEYVELLYRMVPQCFCQRLDRETLHLTLHDLSNSPDLDRVEGEMTENRARVEELAKGLGREAWAGIRLKSRYIFNMVNMSLVLGVYPATEEDYGRLMKLYRLFDRVKKLDYPLTPHITLAYYHTDGFDASAAGVLEALVEKLNGALDLEIGLKELCYQRFRSMNNYDFSVPLIELPCAAGAEPFQPFPLSSGVSLCYDRANDREEVFVYDGAAGGKDSGSVRDGGGAGAVGLDSPDPHKGAGPAPGEAGLPGAGGPPGAVPRI